MDQQQQNKRRTKRKIQLANNVFAAKGMDENLTDAEKEVLSALYQEALQRHVSTHSTSSSEDEFAPFLVKESATWAEYEYVADSLSKNRTEWIQGRIFVCLTSELHEKVARRMGDAVRDAIQEQSQELEKIVTTGGAPSIRWRDGGYRQPDDCFFIEDDDPEVRDKLCLIVEVNYKGSSTAIFREKLEGWITQTEEVMVVIGLDLKPSLRSIHVYYYVRSPVDQTTAVSQFLDADGEPTFESAPPLTQLDIDLRSMLRQCRELYHRFFPFVNGQPVQCNLRVSLTHVLNKARREYRHLTL